MKKLSVLVILCLILGLFAGCGAKEAEQTKADPFKIAVATIFEGESWEVQKTYYETEVAPTLNMEFMISEKLSDANSLIDFMEKAYAAGCVGIINYVTSNDAVAQGARKAEEFGMYFITQNSALNNDVAEVAHNLGHCGASATGMGNAYMKAFENLLSDGENHSLFIFSGAAVGGAIGQGAASHYYSVKGMLEAMQKQYNLTYEKSIEDIINNQDPGEVVTGNPDIKIYIYPGTDVAAATTAVQTQLQTGAYDTFAAVFSYSAFANVIGDVEKSINKDIRIIGTASIEAQTATGFTTLDAFGNTVLNAAVVNPLNNANAMCAVILYNALTGHADAMKDNGKAILFKVEPWACNDAATYEGLSKLDTSSETYVMGAEDLRALCVEDNANVTYKDIEAKLADLADVNAIIAAKIG
ncbi:MAG: hypothetical protein VB021_06835 [Oscillospiraceae bacterium]|nr:hypothetical protein [Oscillospiraceae bacterium]